MGCTQSTKSFFTGRGTGRPKSSARQTGVSTAAAPPSVYDSSRLPGSTVEHARTESSQYADGDRKPSLSAAASSASKKDTGASKAGDRVTDPHQSASARSRRVSGNGQQAVSGNDAPIDPGMFITQQKGQLSERYVRDKKLGSGAYGEVLLCRDKQTNAERAIKVIKRTEINANSSTSLLEEVAVVKQLDHPNIMKLYEVFEDKKNFYIVMEVYKGGELFDEIINKQKFTEADAARTIKQVISGVTYLHKHHIVHRDLKPENLLLESKTKDAQIKIVDFGLSSYFDSKKKMKERLGTAYYIAPEVLRQKYDEKCDVWSIGVILYILLCGYPPFGGSTDREILHRVEKGKFYFNPADWKNISNAAKDLITKMLTLDPAKRISAEEALAHPWIQQVAQKEKGDVKETLLVNALGNMRKFHASQKLAQAALLFMGSKLTTIEETKELSKIFRSLDVNGDGQLDRKELIEGYVQLMKLKGETEVLTRAQVEEEVDKILRFTDFDRNGLIDYSEFVTVAMDREVLLSRDRLKAAFNLFDVDGSGKIAAQELRRILVDVDDEQWESIIHEVDSNNDGEVDFEEFVSMMQKICLDSRAANTTPPVPGFVDSSLVEEYTANGVTVASPE